MRFLLYGMYGSIEANDQPICHAAVARELVKDIRFPVMSADFAISWESRDYWCWRPVAGDRGLHSRVSLAGSTYVAPDR